MAVACLLFFRLPLHPQSTSPCNPLAGVHFSPEGHLHVLYPDVLTSIPERDQAQEQPPVADSGISAARALVQRALDEARARLRANGRPMPSNIPAMRQVVGVTTQHSSANHRTQGQFFVHF